MNKVAIAFLSKDRVELSKQSIVPLLDGARKGQYHIFWCDGSNTQEGEHLVWDLGYPTVNSRLNVRGGAGAAIVYALTELLNHEENYTHVGLVENDVLLPGDWFPDTFDLFDRGRVDGLVVGAASARCFVDRILFQRDGYAVMHNTGAGMIVLTREAAEIVLKTFRTHWSSDNRRIFAKLSGIDIGTYWAFRTNEHYLTADWGWDAVLAAHGLASLALAPSPIEMIGQVPPLVEQGLELAVEFVEALRNEDAFNDYRARQLLIRQNTLSLGVSLQFHHDPNTGIWTYFPHQMHMLGGKFEGDWRFEECRGFGTFKWVAGMTDVIFPTMWGTVFGTAAILVSGGKAGGKIEVLADSGFRVTPDLPPEGENGSVLQLEVPGHLRQREIRITALTPSVTFYGIQTRERQAFLPEAKFDHSVLPVPV